MRQPGRRARRISRAGLGRGRISLRYLGPMTSAAMTHFRLRRAAPRRVRAAGAARQADRHAAAAVADAVGAVAGCARLPAIELVAIFVLGTLLMRSAGCAHERFRRPRLRRPRRAHPRPAAGRGRDRARRKRSRSAALLAARRVRPGADRSTGSRSSCRSPRSRSRSTYPFTKRFFSLPQAYLGVAFGFGIPMAYAALAAAAARVLVAARRQHLLGHRLRHGVRDGGSRRRRCKIGIRTSAITFGRFDVAAVMACYAAMLALLVGARHRDPARLALLRSASRRGGADGAIIHA